MVLLGTAAAAVLEVWNSMTTLYRLIIEIYMVNKIIIMNIIVLVGRKRRILRLKTILSTLVQEVLAVDITTLEVEVMGVI